MNAYINHVQRRLLLIFLLQIYSSLSITVNVHRSMVNNIVAKKKIPLIPASVPCFLSDFVRLSAPVVSQDAQYYISRPNGDTNKVELHLPEHWFNETARHGKTIITNFIGNKAVIYPENNFIAFKSKENEKRLSDLAPNEFIVGPLLEEDYGNWVLSIYTKDADGDWIELYQVFTMEIIEYTVLEPQMPTLNVGDTFNLSFAYPFPSLETCEIIAPRSAFDRFYNRTFTDFNKCGFTIPNITRDDEGLWTIIGFGRIVYQGDTRLSVIKPTTTTTPAPSLKS